MTGYCSCGHYGLLFGRRCYSCQDASTRTVIDARVVTAVRNHADAIERAEREGSEA